MSYDFSISLPDEAVLLPTDAGPADSVARTQLIADARAELTEVAARAKSGDLQAQSELVRRYMKRISAYVRSMLYQTNAAEDIVQTVFIKMARRIELLREPATFEPWLFTLARNTTIDFLRQMRCRPALVSDERDFSHTADPTAAHVLPEIMEALELALKRLSPRNQNVVRMVVQGFSYRAIAEREGLSVGAVKLRLNRVRPFLRASIGGNSEPTARPARFRPPLRCRDAA